MSLRLSLLLLAILLTLAAPAHAGGNAKDIAAVSFHMETDATDNPKMIFTQEINGRTRYFRRVPEISTNDITAFGPFPSGAGDDFGVAFRLKPNAANRLSAVATANQGRWLIAAVNGRFVDGVIIDKPVNDGFIIIWKGVSLAEINQYDKLVPRIGTEKDKKK
jgi:hypothetical protein